MSTSRTHTTSWANGRARPPSPLARWNVLAWALPSDRATRRARSVLVGILQQAGVAAEAVSDAEIAAAELAANAEMHACRPYEMRVLLAGRLPIWCEVFDAGGDLEKVAECLRTAEAAVDEIHGRGLPIVRTLSGGRCAAYGSTAMTTAARGKVVGFSLIGLGGPDT